MTLERTNPGAAARIKPAREDVDEATIAALVERAEQSDSGAEGNEWAEYEPAEEYVEARHYMDDDVPARALPTDAAERKALPLYSGFVAYFPLAIIAVAELSRKGNDQHNPGKPLHWDRSKSGDEKDALMRHLVDQAIDGDTAVDTDGVLHATKKAWRAMADLQKILEGMRK